MSLLDRDNKFVWHPFTQHQTATTPLPVAKGKDSVLTLDDGTEIIDAISSWWTSLFGHGKKEIVEAIKNQASTLDHVIYAGCTHDPAVSVAEKLIKITGLKGGKTFFSDNGSTAVEVGLKAVTQYWQNMDQSNRSEFITFTNAYHGDTIGAMSAGDPGDFGRPFEKLLFGTHRVPVPLISDSPEVQNKKALEVLQAFSRVGNNLAGIIIEPMCQGAGGMQMTSPETLSKIIALTHSNGGLVILDEVMTGFGRTGKLFAHQHQRLKPDVICLAKGLTGGTLPLSATVFRKGIFEAFLDPAKERAFLHGHSFTANPIACAAANASLTLMESPEFHQELSRISDKTSQCLKAIEKNDRVKSTRQMGTIGVVEMHGSGGYFAAAKKDLTQEAIKHGVLLRPLGSVLYAMPPLSTTNEQLEKIYEVLELCMNECY